MTINVLTLFPEIINTYTQTSIIGRAIKDNKININVFNLRDFGIKQRKMVDGKPYGGGGGMVLRVDVIDSAIRHIRQSDPKTKIILLCPTGETYNQETATKFSKIKSITLICGHYQGYDQRVYGLADQTISIGDYITTGGEIAALAILDSVTRLQPEVLNPDSLIDETFQDDLTEAPLYTEPVNFKNQKVPEVLLTGHHKIIKEFRQKNRKKIPAR